MYSSDLIMYVILLSRGLFVYLLLYLHVSMQSSIRENTFIRTMEGKIVGGKRAKIEQFPYAVMLLENNTFICGGTIINTWSVMTAAHCFGDPPFNIDICFYKIVAGEDRIQRIGKWKPESVYNVSYIIVHEKFDVEQKWNDIAMVFTGRPFQFGKTLKKGVLINHLKWMSEDTKNFTVLGWGVLKEGDNKLNTFFMTTYMRFWSHERCGLDNETGKDRFCLYGDGERDTCYGDSGTGVIWNGFIVGVVSYGEGPCAGLNSTSVYGNVFYFRSWLKTAIQRFYKFYCDNKILSSINNNQERMNWVQHRSNDCY